MTHSSTNSAEEFVESSIRQFEAAWRADSQPSIPHFLSDESLKELPDSSVQQLFEELVMIDTEYRWRKWADDEARSEARQTSPTEPIIQPFRVENYFQQYSEFARHGQPSIELIANEYRARQRWGDQPNHEEYVRRFADKSGQIDQALVFVDEHLPTSSQGSGLIVRCPHCQSTIKIGVDAQPGRLECSTCNRTLSLIRDDELAQKGCQLGSFEIIGRLGVGSFGTVWKARDVELDRIVAVKIPHRGLFDPEQSEHLLEEARNAAMLNHPHIIPVFEIGRENGQTFIVTEHIAGVTLADWLAKHRPSPHQAASLCIVMADALEHAHGRGIIHRDLKPANVMLGEHEQPYLMDFGLSKRLEAELSITADGQILGTPAYMSPEQAGGSVGQIDRRSDIYSLGVMLYEMLAGARPFGGNTEVLLQRIKLEDVGSTRRLNLCVPKDLDTICLRCLEKDPSRRYQTAGQLRDDLQRFTNGEPVKARPITRVDRAWRWCKRNRIVATASAVAMSLLLFLAVAGPLVAWSQARLARREARALAQETLARDDLSRQLYFADMQLALQTWEAGDARQVRVLLDRYLPVAKQRDLRGFEWYYLQRLLQRNENVPTLAFELPLSLVAFSPDGRRFATASGQIGDRFEIKWWDPQSNASLGGFELNERNICAGAFSPDAQTIALGDTVGTIRLKSTSDAVADFILSEHTDQILSLAFSPGGTKLASRSRSKVVLWDLGTRKVEWDLETNEGPPNAPPTWYSPMAFSPNGEILAWGTTDGTIRLCDVATRAEQSPLGQVQGTISSVAFSPDGKFLASTSMGSEVVLWEVSSHRRVHVLEGHQGYVVSVSFSADGNTLASAGQDNTIRLWDVSTGEQSRILHGHTGGVTTVAFSPTDGTLASGGEGRAVRLWKAAYYSEQDIPEGHSDIVWDTAFSPDNSALASASWDGTIRLWDVPTGTTQRMLQDDTEYVWSVAYAPNGKKLVSGSGVLKSGSRVERVKLWDAGTGDLLHVSSFATATVRSVAYGPKGKWIAIGTEDGKVLLLDALSLELSDTLGVHADAVYCVEFSPNGETLASSGRDGLVKLWDIEEGSHRDLRGHGGLVFSVAFSPDGKTLASGSRDNTVKLWDVPGRRDVATLTGHRHWVMSVAFSRDGQTLASGDGLGAVTLWDVATRQRRGNLRAHTGIKSLRFSPDGHVLATSAGSKVRLWRAPRTIHNIQLETEEQ